MLRKIVLLFSLLYSVPGITRTDLPFLNLNGYADKDERIAVDITFKAGNLNSKACYNEINYGDSIYKHPHVYDIAAVTLANYRGHFYLDIDLHTRLLQSILKDYNRKDLTPREYFYLCDFEVSMMQFSSQDTNLIIRSGDDSQNNSVFHVDRGSTRTADFYWNDSRERINLWFIIDESE